MEVLFHCVHGREYPEAMKKFRDGFGDVVEVEKQTNEEVGGKKHVFVLRSDQSF